MISTDIIIQHHGIKGQKWGVRRFQNEDGTRTALGKMRLRRQAGRDAKEYARAKMYYGEGAGNRRKLIKATVNQRSKDDYYKQQFDKALEKQNMAKHAKKAKHERRVTDIVTGHPERIGAGMTLAYVAYQYGRSKGVDKVVSQMAKRTISSLYNDSKTAFVRHNLEKQWKNYGVR